MYRLYQDHDLEDFQAKIRIFTVEEGGRSKVVFNGVRWDFKYMGQNSGLYMIWPDFYDHDGNSFPSEVPLPTNKWINARMYIARPEMRNKVHRLQIQEGTKFNCMEGVTSVAEDVVSRIVGLYGNSC